MQTQRIREWFETLPVEYQGDIASFAMICLQDGFDPGSSSDQAITSLLTWLDAEAEFAYRTLGKALSFAAVFENIFGERFTPEGWKSTRSLLEGATRESRIVESAKAQLDDLPRKQAAWESIGRSWQDAKSNIDFHVPLGNG